MRIYISGQITNLPTETAKAKFRAARHELKMRGFEPVDPLADEVEGLTWAEYMAADIILLDACDAIYMLNNWQESDGARIEHFIAQIRGKKIYYQGSKLDF